MKFTIPAKRLADHLQAVIGAIPATSTMPILACVLIRAEAGRLTLQGSDTQLQLTASRPADIEQPGELCTPAKKLLSICKALPASCQVTLQESKGKLEVRSNRSQFSLSTLPAADFPSADQSVMPVEVEVTQAKLQRLLKKTAHAMATQDVRYYLNGTALDLRGGTLNAVATDGHRMAIYSTPVDNQDDAQMCLVPRHTASILEALLATVDTAVTLRMGATQLAVDLPLGDDGVLQFSSGLINGRYPDYQRVVPRGNNRALIANREELAGAVARIGLLSSKSGGMQINLSRDHAAVTCWNESQERATDGIDAEYAATDLEIGVCYSYLLDSLKVISASQAVITFGTAENALLLTDPDDDALVLVVMPMRI